MFWKSIAYGLVALFDWHIVVGILGIIIALILYLFIISLITGNGESRNRSGTGCLLVIIGQPLVQALSVSAFILFCLPAIIGDGGFTPLELARVLAWPFIKTGIIAMGFILILCFIPIIGELITNIPGVTIFLQGILMLKSITINIFCAMNNGQEPPSSVFPSFWNSIGYVLIGFGMCVITLIVVALIEDQKEKRKDPWQRMMNQYNKETSSTLAYIAIFICQFLGIAPLIMYGQYISLSLAAM